MALTVSPIRFDDANKRVSLPKIPASPKKGGFCGIANNVQLLAIGGNNKVSTRLSKMLFAQTPQSRKKRIKQLIHQAQFGTKAHREKAMDSLGKMKAKGAIRVLSRIAKLDIDPDMRDYAVISLAQIKGRQALTTIIHVLNTDTNFETRHIAASMLSNFKDKRAVSALITALKKDLHHKVRGEAASSLGKLHDRKAVQALVRALEDIHSVVQNAANSALARMGGKMLVGTWKRPTTPNLLEALTNDNFLMRYAAAQWFRQAVHRGKDAKRVLKALQKVALKDKVPAVRSRAIHSLAWAQNVATIPTIMKALKDTKTVVRLAAVLAITAFCHNNKKVPKEAAPAIIAIMLNEKEHISTRHHAGLSLWSMGDRRAVPAFIKMLGHKDKRALSLSVTAAGALGVFKDQRAVKPLIAVLLHADANVRHNAAISLGQLKNQSAVKPLVARAKDKRERRDVRKKAVLSLGYIGGSKAIRALRKLARSKGSLLALYATAALGLTKDKRAVKPLLRALKHRSWRIRLNAVWALGQIKEPRSIRPLRKCLSDPDPRVKKMVVSVLKQFKDKRAKGAPRKAGHK